MSDKCISETSQFSDSPERAFLNALQNITKERQAGWAPEFLIEQTKSAAKLGETLFRNWLIRNSVHKKHIEGEVCMLLPYVSYRLLNGPARLTIRLDRLSPKKMEEIIDVFCEEFQSNKKDQFIRTINRVTIEMLLKFLNEIYLQTEQ